MRVIAGAIIYRLNKRKLEVLLVHQSNKQRSEWSIPKGGARVDEPIEAAARRETLEETNVSSKIFEFLGYIDYGKADKRFYCYMAQCPTNVDLRYPVPEIDELRFFEVSRAKKMVDRKQRTLLTTLQRIMVFSTRKSVAV